MTIRRPRGPDDWGAIRTLCCLTGHGGEPIEAERWPFFAELWIGPYQQILPEWTYVAEITGAVVGYLTGCPDTRAFARARVLRFVLPLVLRVARGAYRRNADTRRFVRRALGLEQSPDRRLLEQLSPGVRAAYPAHLHLNVDVGVRGRGVGRGLVERFLGDLRRGRVRGVHLVCGPGPRAFYARLGFRELGRLELRAGASIYALGLGL